MVATLVINEVSFVGMGRMLAIEGSGKVSVITVGTPPFLVVFGSSVGATSEIG